MICGQESCILLGFCVWFVVLEVFLPHCVPSLLIIPTLSSPLNPLIPTVLLAHPVDPSNLKDNVIKITDFGLAREIEHTTHMSGAGTYPWMAPEVIRTSDFSKKSDVWRYV